MCLFVQEKGADVTTYIVSYSKEKNEIIQKLKEMGADTEDVGFNNLIVKYKGKVEELRAIEGVTEAVEEEEKRAF